MPAAGGRAAAEREREPGKDEQRNGTEEAEEKEHEEHIYHEPTIAPRRPKNVCDMPHNHNKLDTETQLIDHA